MPYSVPAPAPAPLPIHSIGRPGHRRGYAAPSSGPGAFAPLGVLPRRRPKKTVFHLSNDDDDDDNNSADDSHDHHHHDVDDDDVLHNIPPTLRLKPNNSFRLAIYNEDDEVVPPVVPLRTLRASVPFPMSSPHSSPPTLPLPPPSTPAEHAPRPNVTRTTSTPIFLSNGKPLKSSLKSSSSSPHITLPLPTQQQPPAHLRSRSAPSTPNVEHPVHKNVHFPSNEEGGLTTVRVFNRSAKPASLSRPGGDDTETETEGELSTGSNSGFIRGASAVFPFPRSPLSNQDKGSGVTAASASAVRHEVNATESSPIPERNPPPHANVYLESLSYNLAVGSNGKIPPGLSGTLLVRNIAYEKQVAVRFTLDDWQTTSEVSAKHYSSLPTLPDSFLSNQQLTYGDIAAQPTPPTVESPQWDRFTFHIKLEDYAFKLAQRTLFLVVRYNANATTGPIESWDNNSGNNYKIAFREAGSSVKPTHTQQLRSRVFAVSSPPSFAPVTTPTTATMNSTPTTTTMTQPHHAQMIAQTTLLRLRKLNLRNYAAPSLTIPSPAAPAAPPTISISTSSPTSVSSSSSTPSVLGASSEAQAQGRDNGGNSAGMGITRVVGPTTAPTTDVVKEDDSIGSESGSESEDDELKTPTGYNTRSRTPSPVSITGTGVQDPAGRRSHSDFFVGPKRKNSPPPRIIQLLTFSSSSASSSASSTPPSENSPQLSIPIPSSTSTTINGNLNDGNGGLDIPRPSVLSPLEMGTSPPFSMMADLGPNFSKRRDYPNNFSAPTPTSTPTPTDNNSKEGENTPTPTNAPVYWPWGMMMAPTPNAGPVGPLVAPGVERQKSEQEVRKVLAGIREKSTSSPVRRVSPSSGGSGLKGGVKEIVVTGNGRSSPVKESTAVGGKEDLGTARVSPVVASPQPRMPNWSKVGSGWNGGSGSPSTAAAAAAAAATGGVTSHPKASPINLTTTTTTTTTTTGTGSPLRSTTSSTTPTNTPSSTALASLPPTTTNHQDSVYQAFVRQWCFAQGPSPTPGQSSVVHPPVHPTGPARYGSGSGREEGGAGAGGQVVV